MTKTHEGRVAVVTGSASGIGQGIAIRHAERGASVALLDVQDCTETVQRIRALGAEVIELRTDVSVPKDWEAAAAAIMSRFGRVDILVNSAAINPVSDFADVDYETWSRVLRINLDGAFLGAKTLSPIMAASKWGRIVHITSASIGSEVPGFTPYMSSKMGLIGLTRGLANDLGKHGITVNAVAPGITNTPAISVLPPEMLKAFWSRQPIARLAEPSDIAGPVVFLTSEDAGLVTGQTIVVDGGLVKL